MHILFADDSTQDGSRQGMGTLVSFGGFLLEASNLQGLDNRVNSVFSDLNVPIDTEIKWSLPPGNWIRENLEGDKRIEFYREVLQVLADLDAIAVVAVWDCGRTSLQGDDAFNRCVDFIFERVSIELSKLDSDCLVIADRPGGGKKQEEGFLEAFLQRVQTGTEFAPPDRVLLNLLTTPARLVRHLQLADLVTSITTAMVAMKYRYARPAFDQIRPLFMKNSLGYVGGTGLKLFPNQLTNLYHWVLGEDTYVRVGMNSGWGLPMRKFPYHDAEDSDGIPF